MTIHTSVLTAIGNTPLIRLNAASEATGCEILGKAEFPAVPGSSIARTRTGLISRWFHRGSNRCDHN